MSLFTYFYTIYYLTFVYVHFYFCVCMCTFETFFITNNISSNMAPIGIYMNWVNFSMILLLGKMKIITLLHFNIVRNKWIYTGKIFLISNVFLINVGCCFVVTLLKPFSGTLLDNHPILRGLVEQVSCECSGPISLLPSG